MPNAWAYTRAFKANCPHARLDNDETDELMRLFKVAQDEARQDGINEAFQEIERRAKVKRAPEGEK